VHQSYQKWLSDTLRHWQRGRMLTIDYGSRDSEIYHRQPQGSLRAYFHHQRLSGPEAWSRPGHQDLTADVNFSDLIKWSHPKVELVSLVPQSEFLAPYLDPNEAADQYAVDPSGPGSAFLCLDQRKTG
jgi:SAM-dependent MidA family methyltransferase